MGMPCLIPCMHGYDTPERHRQAVYFNVCGAQGDYFIFSDWDDLMETGGGADGTAARCSSRVICTVRFEDPAEKDRFRRVLAVCLFCSSPTLTFLKGNSNRTSNNRSTRSSRLPLPLNPHQPAHKFSLVKSPPPVPNPPTISRTLHPNPAAHHRRAPRVPNRLGRMQPGCL